MKVCNHDCFNCPYPDCIRDEDITALEKIQADKLDNLILSERKGKNNKKVYDKTYRKKHKEQIKIAQKKYREEHREELKAIHRKYYQENKERLLAWQKKYNDEHKEQIKAYKQERYRKGEKSNDCTGEKEITGIKEKQQDD